MDDASNLLNLDEIAVFDEYGERMILVSAYVTNGRLIICTKENTVYNDEKDN